MMNKIGFGDSARFVTAIFFALGIACRALALPFVTAGALNMGRVDHTATLLADGRVLVTGGSDTSNNNIPSCEVYNPVAGTWALTVPMSSPRIGHTATLLPNGKVLVTGGFSGTGTLASAQLYDPASGLWTYTMSMTTAREAHTATLLTNGMVLVTGGYGDASGWLASAEMFNPNTGVWRAVAPLQTARSQHTATMLADGKVFVTGGYNGLVLANAEVFDPATETWASRPAMINPRASHSATLLANGKVLVAGGQNNSGDLASAELFDPVGGGWLMTSSMATAKQGACAALLSDGKVLVTGGHNATSGFLPLAEIYDPSAGTWLFSLPMLNPRVGHTATLLANGKVLVAGGYNAAGCLAATELYGCLVSFDAAGGTPASAAKIYYADGEVYGTLPVPSRTAYLFAGWWTGPDGTGIQAADTAVLAAVFDHTLYAKWTGPVTVSTPVPVPYTWLAQYPVPGDQSAANYETAALADLDGDGQAAWQEYLAGSVPTNTHSFFQARIAVSNGTPRLTWSPDLGSARVYLFEGKTNLADSAWGTTNAGSRFFRAKVSMP